jgi:hypothetical protein
MACSGTALFIYLFVFLFNAAASSSNYETLTVLTNSSLETILSEVVVA